MWLQGLGGSRKSVWLPWGWEEKKRIGADCKGNGCGGLRLPLAEYLQTTNIYPQVLKLVVSVRENIFVLKLQRL